MNKYISANRSQRNDFEEINAFIEGSPIDLFVQQEASKSKLFNS